MCPEFVDIFHLKVIDDVQMHLDSRLLILVRSLCFFHIDPMVVCREIMTQKCK